MTSSDKSPASVREALIAQLRVAATEYCIALVESARDLDGLKLKADLRKRVGDLIDALSAAPAVQPAAQGMEAALRWIMHTADNAKEPCGTDLESPAAIRNSALAGIAGAAAQGLGLVRGPDLAASTPSPASPTAPAAVEDERTLGCGHSMSLAVTSAESGQFLYCELCDAKSGRRDAEQMEAELRKRAARLETALRDISAMTYDAWSNGARAGEIASAALSTAAVTVSVPRADCDQCNGTGEVFEHAEDCHNDLCALNGDEHSCVGRVVECSCVSAAAVKAAEVPAPVLEAARQLIIECNPRLTSYPREEIDIDNVKLVARYIVMLAAAPAQGKAVE